MVTYLGKPELKSRFIEEIGKHEEQDRIIKGTYSEPGKVFRGCAIGCSLHSLNLIEGAVDQFDGTDNHSRYEKELGLPTWLAYLEDNIFENLPLDQAKTWPRRFAEAVPVGAVVGDVVLAKILRWVLADSEFGVRFATDDAEIRGYIDTIVTMFEAEIVGQATAEQREAAASAASAARAAMAASAAMDAWAAWAASAAMDAWAARAASAAMDAWAASTDPEGKKADAFFPSLSEYVLSLLRDLPPALGVDTASEAV